MNPDHGDFLLTREVTASLDMRLELPFLPALVAVHFCSPKERAFHWKMGSPKVALQTHRLLRILEDLTEIFHPLSFEAMDSDLILFRSC